MLKSNLVGLVAIERSDLKQLMNWRNNPEFRKHFREYRELNMAMQEKWFEQKVLNDPSTMMFAIRRLKDDELLGCCGFVYINWVHRNADLSLYIGWENAYIDTVGYAEESCRLLFDYGFGELSLHKIWTEIYEFDIKKWTLFQKLGFKQDGMLRDNYFYDGKWWGSMMISLLGNDYDLSKSESS
jgi:RimJ/RimL family protein N-acetyltransferase